MDQQPTDLKIPAPPKGGQKLKWLGPGFLWMVSAAGSGELLFSPRVGAMYGYTLIWALVGAVLFKWFINREIGRYTVCTGATVIDGFSSVSKSFVYIILIPQLFVAVTTIAGLAGSSATALILVFKGDIRIWTIASIIVSTILVSWGRFKTIERIATVLAVLLSLSTIVAAITVFPKGEELLRGFIPAAASTINYEEILPWLGFILSGAAGMIWYSYWIQKKGYGAAGQHEGQSRSNFSRAEIKRLKGWIRQMTLDNHFAVIGTLVITLSFLILGAELLKPQGLVPEENQVAQTLGKILEQLWGPIGFWFMVTAVFIGFWDTVLSDQDGFGRMFAGGSKLLLKRARNKRWLQEKILHRFFVIVICTILPIILYLRVGEPVKLLKIAGIIEAAHIPFLVVLVLILNHKKLPVALRPSLVTTVFTAIAGLFFTGFTIVYVLHLLGIISLK